MKHLNRWTFSTLGISLACSMLVGCIPGWKLPKGPRDTKTSFYDSVSTRIEYPDVQSFATNAGSAAISTSAPFALEDPSQLPTWDLSLEDAIQMAIGQGPVLRSIGGSVVAGAQGTSTVFDPALADANPLGGVEAALSDFDAQYTSQLFWQKIDRPQNRLFALQPPALEQVQANYTSELSKITATGASFAARHDITYARNPLFAPLRSTFDGQFELEARQPLLQGSGVQFNRIAGPNSTPGNYNGVLIARINNDISLADFENAVIQLTADVEQAYWNLYLAYRNLEAQLRGRESALQTFQYQELRLSVGAGRSDEEAQARSQFYQFQVQVENALASDTGLYRLEQQLRYMLGLPASDGRLIKPTSDPTDTQIVFDWTSVLGQSLERRVEIRRQKWNVKRRQLELYAAKLNKRPTLDFLGQYRWRGLADHLIGDRDNGALDNLYAEITGGDYQEWQAGLELSFPVGMRRASVAIAHAQLNHSRELALLGETELRISHDLADASRELQRSYKLLQTNYNRWLADRRQLEVLSERYLRGADNINFLLQAQSQVVNAETNYYRTLTEYNLAIRNLHQQKGTLLSYNHVHLAEHGWHGPAYCEAYERGRSLTPCLVPSKIEKPRPVSRGSFDPSAPGPTMSLPGSFEVGASSNFETSPISVAAAPGMVETVSGTEVTKTSVRPASPLRLPQPNSGPEIINF